jgi:hypothetical protein
MRHPVRALVAVTALVAVLAIGYAAAWYYVAGRVREAVIDWAEARRVEGVTAGWDRLDVGGFPFGYTVRLEKPVLEQTTIEPGYDLRAPVLVASAPPWSLTRWRLEAAQGIEAELQPGPARPALRFEASHANGDVHPVGATADAVGGTQLTLKLDDASVQGDQIFRLARAELETVLPGRPALDRRTVWLPAALRLTRLTLPAGIGRLGEVIDELTLRASVKGTIPGGPRRAALAAWRDAGGTVEVEALGLEWGPLAASAGGTLALDGMLQPIGALTAKIQGYGEIIDTLAARGAVKAGDAALAKVGLSLLAKPAANGRSEISTSVTLQNGQIFLGPVRVGDLPRFTWE